MHDRNIGNRFFAHGPLSVIADGAVGLILVIGLIGLSGFGFNLSIHTTTLSALFSMKVGVAFCFVLSSISLLLSRHVDRYPSAHWGAFVCAALVSLFGLVTLSEYATGMDLGIDQFFSIRSDLSADTRHTARMAVMSAFSFSLLGTALICAGVTKLVRVSQVISLVVGLLGLLPLVGYLYGTLMHFGFVYTPMSLHSAVLFVVMSVCIFMLRPDQGLAKTVWNNTQGGWIFRRLAPFVFVTPILIGWIQLHGEDLGYYDSAFRIAIMMVVLVAILGTALWLVVLNLDKSNLALHQAQMRMQENEDSYRNQFANSSVVMLLVDPKDGSIIDANAAAQRFYGYALSQLRSMSAKDINILPAADVLNAISTIPEGEGRRFEFNHRLADGTVRTVEVSSTNVRFGERTVLHSIINDITDRKIIEAELRNSEEKYRLLVQNSVSAIATHRMIFDEAGKPVDYVFLNANAAFEEHTGLCLKDVIGRRVTEVLPGIERTSFVEIYGRVVQTGEPITFEQHTKQLARHFFVNAYRLDEGCFATVFTDITKRKCAEASLQEREAFLSLLLETIPIPVFVKDRNGRYVIVNKAFETLFWKSKVELIGKTVFDVLPLELAQVSQDEDSKLFAHPGEAAYYSQVQDGLGIIHNVIFQKVALVDNDGIATGLIGTILNITDQQRLEEELSVAKLELEEATELANELKAAHTRGPSIAKP